MSIENKSKSPNKDLILKNDDEYFKIPPKVKKFSANDDFKLVLDEDYPKAVYRDFKQKYGEIQYTIYPKEFNTPDILDTFDPLINGHWGQRKLFNSELLFLYQFTKPMLIIYVGSAPCIHLALLDKIIYKKFNIRHIYHLYDGRPFNLTGSKITTDNLKYKIFNSYFTDATANIYTNEDVINRKFGIVKDKDYTGVVLISDIRRENIEYMILEDQALQMGWVKIIKPIKSLLKFKMPYPSINKAKNYNYLDGKIWLQIYAPVVSAETRLEVDGKNIKMKEYNIIDYEQQMSWYNNIARLRNLNKYVINDFNSKLLSENTGYKFTHITDKKIPMEDYVERIPVDRYITIDFIFEMYVFSLYIGDNINKLIDMSKEITEISSQKHDGNLLYNLNLH